LFDEFQFAIVIENEKHANWISEKIIDCLITKTIPIYYGCPNISEYFDVSYWIILDEPCVVKTLKKLKNITQNTFELNYDKIEYNYRISKQYVSLKNNITNGLKHYQSK